MKTRITQTFFLGGGDQHAIGKIWTQNVPFASIFLKLSRRRPPDPHLQEGDIHSRIYTAKGKNSPASRTFRSGALKTKITQKNGGKNQHAIGKKMDSECTICIHFSKNFPGEAPRTPTCGRGVPPPALSPCGASRRFGYAPWQWTLWIRHCVMTSTPYNSCENILGDLSRRVKASYSSMATSSIVSNRV